MAIVLFRLDERLIHGQVVVGWGSYLRPDRYLVVDDALASSEWEQELYALGSGGTETVFTTAAEARDRIPDWRSDDTRSVLLVRDVGTLERLGEGGLLDGMAVNLGGLHHGADRMEVLTYLHLSPAESAALEALQQSGAELSAQDLPGAPRVPFRSLRRA